MGCFNIKFNISGLPYQLPRCWSYYRIAKIKKMCNDRYVAVPEVSELYGKVRD